MRTIRRRAVPTEARRETVGALIEEIGRSFRELRCVGSQRLVKLGVSMTHLHILTLVKHHGAMPMSRLADLLDVSLSNATGLIDRLEDRGYVERVRVPDDRRVVLVQLTPAADRVLEEADVLRADLMTAVLRRLDESDLARVEAGFTAFRDALLMEFDSDPVRYAHRHDVPAAPALAAEPAHTATT
jgi:DNA-binding MarR family transcriptional regulator